MVPLKELGHFAVEEMHSPVCEGIVSNADPTCFLKLCNEGLVWIVIKVVYYKVARDTAPGCICHLLQSDACHHLMVHIISRNEYAVPCLINFVP